LWGSAAFALGYLLVGLKTGASGGPPNILVPSTFIGLLFGALSTGFIAQLCRRWPEWSLLLLALILFAAGSLSYAGAAVLVYAPD
jgi:hypothetical protein